MKNWFSLSIFIFLWLNVTSAQSIVGLIPDETATHKAINDGSWFTGSTWNTGTVPTSGAIVVIPSGKSVTYEGGATTTHLFAIKVAGNLTIQQTSSIATTNLVVDTFIGLSSSKIYIHANTITDGKINIVFKPFDIVAHKAGTSGYPLNWSATAKNHFSDGANHYAVTYKVNTGNVDRFDTAAQGNAATSVTEYSSTLINDGAGVYGRSGWDPEQLSLGLVTSGEIQVLGQKKTNMVKLSGTNAKGQKNVNLVSAPTGWLPGDDIFITTTGKQSTVSKGLDKTKISTINGSNIVTTNNLVFNHEPNTTYDFNGYVGNLTRNITFSSGDTSAISRRGHVMAMMNPTDVQFKDASFLNLGRTDKSKLLDDFIFDQWITPTVAVSKLSALGQECMQLKLAAYTKMTNVRGRYSLHLHKTGASTGVNAAIVDGCVVWGNPGWGLVQHDSHADISNNVVYDVKGAGIVSEAGNETGSWFGNIVSKIDKGRNGDGDAWTPVVGQNYFDPDMYHSALFYDDYLFRGEGLAMRGRAVVCRDNVITDANFGVGVTNMNPVKTNLKRLSADDLKGSYRNLSAYNSVNHAVDQFPLDINQYSAEGDGVMPVEAALIMLNTTTINCYTALNSIERDMGVSSESRSVFDGFVAWGVNVGMTLTYQMDYSFKDVYISGKNMFTTGVDLWKHAHNHSFENMVVEDMGETFRATKLVGTSTDYNVIKSRNNQYDQWAIVNLTENNITNHYASDGVGNFEMDTEGYQYVYKQHADNFQYWDSSDLDKTRAVGFTLFDGKKNLNSAFLAANPNTDALNPIEYHDDIGVDLEVDVASGDYKFKVNGMVHDSGGYYSYGTRQAWAQDDLRFGYPQRIYQFASKTKFEDYLSTNGVYKDAKRNDQLYFILYEYVPDRFTFEYKKFPIRVDIKNANSNTAPYSNAVYEPLANLKPTTKILSLYGSATQSSTSTTEVFDATGDNVAIPTPASRAIDGNTNGRLHANIYQRGDLPYGSSSYTQNQSEPWWELDLGQASTIEHIDVFGTQTLNGLSKPTRDAKFQNFYVLISDVPFGNVSLTAARAMAKAEYFRGTTGTQVFRKSNVNIEGRYVRIQAVGTTQLALAEVLVYGKDEIGLSNPDNSPCGGLETNGILTNADFECGTATDWSLVLNSGTVAQISDDAVIKTQGDIAANVKVVDFTTADYNNVKLISKTYIGDLKDKVLGVSFYSKSSVSNAKGKLSLVYVDNTGANKEKEIGEFTLLTDFNKYAFDVAIEETTQSAYLQFLLGNEKNTYFIDDVKSILKEQVECLEPQDLEIVKNGDVECLVYNNWKLNANEGVIASLEDTSDVYAGNNAGMVTISSLNASPVSGDVVLANEAYEGNFNDYTISFKGSLKSENVSSAKIMFELKLKDGSTEVFEEVLNLNSTYQEFLKKFYITKETSSIQFKLMLGDQKGIVYFDELSAVLSKTPQANFYPNPAVSEIKINTPRSILKAKLTSTSGKENPLDFLGKTIYLNNAQGGIYFLEIILDDGTTVLQKVIVK